MSKEKLVVIGGDAAGMSAASQARRQRSDLDIIAFEKTPHTSYAACGIPYYVGDMIKTSDQLVARAPEVFREKQNIDARVLHEVVEIDLEGRRVKAVNLSENAESWESFDKLLIATGASPIVPDVPGKDAEGVFTISSLESGLRCREALDRLNPRNAVVIGGGYIGIEMAEALLMRGCDVTMIEMAPQVMPTLDQDMAGIVAQKLADDGVELLLEEPLTGFDVDSNGRVLAVTTSNRTIPTDFTVLAIGIRPESNLAAAAGVPLGDRNAIRINERMETGIEGVWSAGDCAESKHLVSGKPFWVALGTVANKHGRVAGINIAGGNAVFPGVVGTAITKFNELEIARTGLQQREIDKLGIDSISAKIHSKTRAHYYPGAELINVKLFAEKGNGRLLGAQIIGGPGSGKRIDTAAAALHAGMTIEDLINLDLSYAPPFSPVWDPLQIAARVLLSKL
ncbi:MAG TPA: FAD-dependent oxidoreductase [Acidobacteriota bacterium]|nr:FAD-dependent oxidoreductase [Acidobacteriota bacterium]